MKDDGSGRKIAAHAIIGGLMSQITGAGFASGAIGAGLNEALINNLKGLDPTIAQIASGVLGAAAAKIVNGDATAGAIAAASGTKWNYFLMEHPDFHGVGALAQHILKREDGKELSSEEILQLIQGMNSIFSEEELERANAQNRQSENVKNYPKAISYLTHLGITKNSAIQFFKEYNNSLRKQDWNIWEMPPTSINVTVDKNTGKAINIQRQPSLRQYTAPIQAYPPAVFTGENLVLPDTPLTTHEKKDATGAVTNPGKENHGDKADNQSKAALGKTIGIETFKAAADLPVTLYNKYHDNPVKALKIGIFAPLGLGYDMYQDSGKYSGTDLAKVTLVNGGAFAATSFVDAWLIGSAGMSVETTILANIIIVKTADELKKIWARSDKEKRRGLP